MWSYTSTSAYVFMTWPFKHSLRHTVVCWQLKQNEFDILFNYAYVIEIWLLNNSGLLSW
jgi:hypothetical protein